MSRTLNVSWLTSPKPGNFGDILSPYILSKYGYNVNFVPWNAINNADVISVGSIARLAKAGISVLGSGIISKTDILDPSANWVWVRGPRTRTRIIELGGYCPEIYGDPALLLPRITAPSPKKFKVGVVPHHVDYLYFKETYPELNVINLINKDVEEVIKQITECEQIISSSLHGLITANAYNIPAAWIKHNKLVGDDTKFFDYFESVNVHPVLSTFDNPYFMLPLINTDQIDNILKLGVF